MNELLTHRAETFRYELLDLNDQLVSLLDGVHSDGGQLDFSVAGNIRGSGNMTVQKLDPAVDWLRHRVRVSYVLGDRVEALITAIPAAPVEHHSDEGVTVDVELYDKTLILTEDSFPGVYGLPAGTLVLDAVADVIVSTGETSSLFGDSDATLDAAMVWEAGTSKLQIVNDLLDAAGFFSLYCDGMGRFRADPYVVPAARGVAWSFADDEDGLYLPDFSRDMDTFSVPNRFVCVGRSDDPETDAPIAVAEDNDPASPFSFVSRGRWITRTDTGVEAVDLDVLELIARRRLSEAQQATETFEIDHAWLPVGLNGVVSFTNSRLSEPVRAVVQKQSVKLVPGGLVTSTLRRVL